MIFFIENEISKLIKLRFVSVFIIVFINCSILLFFSYQFYQTFQQRNISGDFLSFAGLTLVSIQILFSLIFIPLLVIIFKRFNFAIKNLKDCNEDFANLYKQYCSCRPRLFSEIPKYILNQFGLNINGNLKRITLNKKDFNAIKIRRINLGKYGKKCRIQFYQNEKKNSFN